MEIDVSTIMDFLYCPLIVKHKENGVITPLYNIKEKYIDSMKKFVYAYNVLLDNNGINIEKAKNIFAKMWLSTKKDKYIYVDSGDYRNTYELLRKKGIDSVIEYHERAKKTPYIPVVTNLKYRVPVGAGIYLTGIIDIVIQRNNKVELICIKPLTSLYRKENLSNDIEIVTSLYAYEYMFSKEPDKAYVYALDKNFTVLCDYNKQNMISTVKNIASIINQKLYYRANYDRCYKCIYYNECTRNDL